MSVEDQLAIVGRMAFALALGALVGLDRELRGYPAGVRTISIVTLGAALFTDISRDAASEGRIAAGIVTGIGFLGAGVIFREGYSIQGITTAATIWSAAAIGMAVGHELYLAAGLGSLLVFIVLESRPFVRRLDQLLHRLIPNLTESWLEEEDKARNEIRREQR